VASIARVIHCSKEGELTRSFLGRWYRGEQGTDLSDPACSLSQVTDAKELSITMSGSSKALGPRCASIVELKIGPVV
jgi:hypothetical protein